MPRLLSEDGIVYITSQTASGKTYHIIQWLLKQDLTKKKIIYSVPRYTNMDDFIERFKAAYYEANKDNPLYDDIDIVKQIPKGKYTSADLLLMEMGFPAATRQDERYRAIQEMINTESKGLFVCSHQCIAHLRECPADCIIIDENIEDALLDIVILDEAGLGSIIAYVENEEKQQDVLNLINEIRSKRHGETVNIDPLKRALVNFDWDGYFQSKTKMAGIGKILDPTKEQPKITKVKGRSAIRFTTKSTLIDSALKNGTPIKLLSATPKIERLNRLYKINIPLVEFPLARNKGEIIQYLGITGAKGNDCSKVPDLIKFVKSKVPEEEQKEAYVLSFKDAIPQWKEAGFKIPEYNGTPLHIANNAGLDLLKGKIVIVAGKYDENDDWCEVTYLNLEGNPSHDGNNCSLVKIKSDEWGNRIKETYHTIDGDNSIRTDMGVSGFTYLYDNNGHCTSITTIGLDGNPMSCRYGYAILEYTYDENGYESQNKFLDTNRNPASLTSEGDSYTRVDIKNNEKGLPIEYIFYDEDGKEQELSHGYSTLKIKYDSIGNNTELTYLNTKHQLALYDGLYSKVCFEYDEFSHIISIKYFDEKNKPAINAEGIYQTCSDYNRQGSIVKMSFYGIDGELSVGSGFFASQTWDYDELGNEKTIQFFDVNGKLTNNSAGVARREFIYDYKTNFILQTKDYNAQGTLISSLYYDYDKRGNVIKQYILNSSGQLQKGTAVEHSEYDDNNRPVAVWYSNQKGQPVNKPGTKTSKIINKYDTRGNIIEKTFWGVDGKPSVDEQGAFKREQRFNDLGLPVYERNLDANGKPLIGKDVNPEGKCEYDKQGNMTNIECYDGYGKPRLSSDGFFKATSKFNHQNKLIEHSFYDVEGNLVMSRSQQYARRTTQYNKSGLELESNYFNEKNKLFRIDTYKYNGKNRMIEQLILNEKKQEEDKFWGYSKMTTEYNENGLIPVQRVFYNKSHQKLGYQKYNGVTKSWGNVVGINQNNSFNIVGNQWKQAIMEFSAMCPVDAGNGVRITSIALEGDIVTCHIRLTTIDTDALEEENLQNLRSMIPTITKQMKKMIGIPAEVKLILIVQDKNGKRV